MATQKYVLDHITINNPSANW